MLRVEHPLSGRPPALSISSVGYRLTKHIAGGNYRSAPGRLPAPRAVLGQCQRWRSSPADHSSRPRCHLVDEKATKPQCRVSVLEFGLPLSQEPLVQDVKSDKAWHRRNAQAEVDQVAPLLSNVRGKDLEDCCSIDEQEEEHKNGSREAQPETCAQKNGGGRALDQCPGGSAAIELNRNWRLPPTIVPEGADMPVEEAEFMVVERQCGRVKGAIWGERDESGHAEMFHKKYSGAYGPESDADALHIDGPDGCPWDGCQTPRRRDAVPEGHS